MSKISKEEILQKNHTISSPVFGYIQVDKSMDEYAEQIAIGFQEWKLSNGYYTPMGGNQKGQYFNSKGEGIAKDAKELYQQYIKSITL